MVVEALVIVLEDGCSFTVEVRAAVVVTGAAGSSKSSEPLQANN